MNVSVWVLLGVIFLLAFMVEGMTEYIFGMAVKNLPKLQPLAWLLPYIALAFGIGAAWVYHLDLIYLFSQMGGGDVASNGLGITLTGLAIGRGSNYVHDLYEKYFLKDSIKG